jgi:stage II sporulation protein D
VELPKSSGYTKASLDDYRMLLKVEKKQKETKAAVEETNEVFQSVYALDTTEIFDPQPDPLNFTDTRSIANEYYTVNDIISGTTVTLNAHEMLCRIVYSEIGSEWGEEAIKAQAVAAYSYLRFNDAMGLTPTVGLKSGYPAKIENCISAVEGQAVFYDGSIINAVYSASTAGYSTESSRIWDVYYPYLRAVVSEYDNEDPNYGLEYNFTEAEVRSILENECGITLSDNPSNWFTPEEVYSGRYVSSMLIDGQVSITARTMKSLFGLKSQAFTVSYDNGNFLFLSYGWGHGVGMSQWGACGYANHGYTYDQILRHYYLNTTIDLSSENSKAVQRGEDYNNSLTTQDDSSQEDTAAVTEPAVTTTVPQTTAAPAETTTEADSTATDDTSSISD